MPLPTLFANLPNPTGQELDADLAALGNLTIIPTTIAGTNALALTPLANTPTISQYANYLVFSGVAVAANTGAVTVAFGGLGTLNAYLDGPGGPGALVGGEIATGNLLLFAYDSALNGGTGGVHIISGARFGSAAGLVAHAGGGQANATPLTGAYNQVSTVGTAADSVLLPTAVVGRVVWVANAAASNSMNIFPSSGQTINALAADTAIALVAGKSMAFFSPIAGKWYSILSA